MRGRSPVGDAASRDSRHDWWGVVLEAPDAGVLAGFYTRLLGWQIVRQDAGHAVLAPPDGVAYLGVQTAPGYVPPVWPPVDGRPRMTMHLDFEVDDLPVAVQHAVELGARLAEHQPEQHVRVLIDPAGHPFCLYVDR